MYIQYVPLTLAGALAMMSDSWEAVDVSILRVIHVMASTVISTTRHTITTATAAPTQIERIKYFNVKLLNKNGIKSFYDNLVT